VSYTLPANVEKLLLQGTDVINGIGNVLNNQILGNVANNRLEGGKGADNLAGGLGDDTLAGGAGNDSVNGDGGDDFLIGGAGNDQYNGGTGIDTISYATITSSVNVSLAIGTAAGTSSGKDIGSDKLSNIENLIGGVAADKLTGSSAANRIEGLAGNDVIDGKKGADKLYGGLGNDVLTGGLGDDIFVFDSVLGAANVDIITDFNVGNDILHLSRAIFKALPLGQLKAAAFIQGEGQKTALDASDRIIYNTSSGELFYDADGSNAAITAKLIGILSPSGTLAPATLSLADFLVV